MTLPSWWQVTTPHKDIREGRLSEAIFAADLGDVVYGRAPLEYQDASLFFQKTYLTRGLKNLLENVLSRLMGEKGDPVIQLKTPFGGGKTHALLALYHLLKHGKDVIHLPAISDLPVVKNAKIAVFVGTGEETLKGRTPWGEIAYQLGFYDEIKEYDEKRYTPGKKILLQVLEKAQPALILMDEIAQYVSKSPPELATQALAFLQELTEAFKVLEKGSLVCTLPSSAPYGEASERALQSLQQIFGRVEALYIPIEGMETYEVIRKRLFEDFGDENTRKTIAQSYFDLYQKLGADVPLEARDLEYRERIERAYPFHPELIDVLYERWGSFPTFQRTRGVLRLMAEVVADLYKRKITSPLIQSSLMNLGNQALCQELIKHIGNEYASVISSDIATKNAKAPKIDREMGTEYEKYGIASGIATAVFLYSFSGGKSQETTLPRIRVSLLREGIPTTIVGDAVAKLEEELWFFHSEGKQFAFRNVPNLEKVISGREETITEERITEELKELVKKQSGHDLEIYLWPEGPSDIPDNKNLKLAVLSPKYFYNSDKSKKLAFELFERAGFSFRIYKNTLFILMSDDNQYFSLSKALKRLLALVEIQKDKSLLETLSRQSQEELKSKHKEAEKDLPFKIFTAYRHLAMLEDNGINWKDLGIPAIGGYETISDRIKQYLKDQEKLLTRLTPKYLLDRTFGKDEQEKSLREIYELHLKTPGMSIPESEKVFIEAVREGVKTGILGVREYSDVYYMEEVFVDINSIVLRGEFARKLKEEQKEKKKGEGIKEPEGKVKVKEGEKEGGGISVTTGHAKEAVKRIILRAIVPWDKMSSIITGVIKPLKEKGFPPEVILEVRADSEEGFDRTTLDSKVKETLNQINAKIEEWKEE